MQGTLVDISYKGLRYTLDESKNRALYGDASPAVSQPAVRGWGKEPGAARFCVSPCVLICDHRCAHAWVQDILAGTVQPPAAMQELQGALTSVSVPGAALLAAAQPSRLLVCGNVAPSLTRLHHLPPPLPCSS